MEFNNNNKDWKRGDHLPPLPPELEWSNMKDGIFDKMRSMEQAELSHLNGKGAKISYWPFLGWVLVLSLVLTAGWFFFFQAGTTGQGQEKVAVVPFHDAEINESGSIDPAVPTHQDEQDEYAEAEMAETAGTNSTSNLLPADEEPASVQGQHRRQSVRMDLDESPETLTLLEDERLNHSSDSDRMGPPQSASETIKRTLRPLAVSAVPNLRIPIPEAREPMPVSPDLIDLTQTNQAASGSQEMDSASLPTIQRPDPVNQLILEGGITFWNEAERTSPW
jgi:hypothetical protein